MFIEKHFGKFTPELLLHEIVAPKLDSQEVKNQQEEIAAKRSVSPQIQANVYYDMTVDPAVVSRMSESRASTDSILPKL